MIRLGFGEKNALSGVARENEQGTVRGGWAEALVMQVKRGGSGEIATQSFRTMANRHFAVIVQNHAPKLPPKNIRK